LDRGLHAKSNGAYTTEALNYNCCSCDIYVTNTLIEQSLLLLGYLKSPGYDVPGVLLLHCTVVALYCCCIVLRLVSLSLLLYLQ